MTITCSTVFSFEYCSRRHNKTFRVRVIRVPHHLARSCLGYPIKRFTAADVTAVKLTRVSCDPEQAG